MKIKYIIVLATLIFKAHAVTNIVAAENFYGELAKEIGGNNVNVQSIINNPDADPHLFTTSPATSKSLSQANIIIYNGADYDNWMEQMLTNVDKNKVMIINVSKLVGVKSGQNPHLWYKDDAFPKVATILANQLIKEYPANKIVIEANLDKFLKEHAKVISNINKIKEKYNGVEVTATEPVFGYMASSMGLNMLGLDFQWKIMNNTEPSPKMIADYENILKNKQVKVLFYNSQVSDSITQNMKKLAKENNIPIVGVTETMPVNVRINPWLEQEVAATSAALASAK